VSEQNETREWLIELLPKSAHKHIDRIIDELVSRTAATVEVVGARLAVETVTAYGLDIGVDANGNAAWVGFPYGADVTEEWL
jgi:hypothetical protein